MIDDASRRNVAGGLPLTIGLVGPSGTGKSTLAKKIARMITRSEHSPNVLLVDADIFGRGLTAQIEGSDEFQGKHLHDVIVGKNTTLSPVELRESCIGPGEWPSLPEDGRVFFVPSSRPAAERVFESVADTGFDELKRLLNGTLASAANSGRAEAVVIDTAPIPEPCGAIFASMCDLIILVGDKDHGEEAIKEHLGRLEEILEKIGRNLEGIPLEIVFNQMDRDLARTPAGHFSAAQGRHKGPFPIKCHVLPAVDGLGDQIADSVDFERRVVEIVSLFLSRVHPGLVPSWCAPLPGEWRKVAIALGESPVKDPRLLHLLPGIAPPFLKRAAFALGIGIPAAACLLLTSSISAGETAGLPGTNSASVLSGSGLRYVGLAIGVCFLLAAVFELLRASVECKTCLVAASRLAAKDLDWILSRLRLKPKHNHKGPPEKRQKLQGQKLNTLHRVFDMLGRSLQESGRFR